MQSSSIDGKARLIIRVNQLWESRVEKTNFDLIVFKSHDKTCSRKIEQVYKQHEHSKKLKYEQGIVDVEHTCPNPHILACTAGARLADKTSQKSHQLRLHEIKFCTFTQLRLLHIRIAFAPKNCVAC